MATSSAPSSETEASNSYAKVVEELRNTFDEGRTLPLEFRLKQLNALHRLVDENFDKMLAAVHKDMRKAKMEGASYELELIKTDTIAAIRELKNWMRREMMPFNLLLPFDKAFVKHDPYGVVLIIGAWNYPFLLSLQPLIGAIAAGNCAVVKPSEHSSNAASMIAELVPKYLDPTCFRVVLGAAPETIELLENKFDYIFATSSTRIGKCVMQAAAKHLTPVTLELGGKSPVYIDDDSDLEIASRRVIWGKCINLGQTCIAPDYILCSKSTEKKFIENVKHTLQQWYGEDPQKSSDLTRIINNQNFLRLQKLLKDTKGRIAIGGQTNEDDLFISPTVVADIKETDSLMTEELFGPILPIITVNSKEEALRFIKARPKPLALYVFSRSQNTLDYFIEKTTSGAICCNDVVVQNGWEGLPFGGVGDSGIGHYHGKYSYETFVHKKSVVQRSFSKVGEKVYAARYPPYNNWNMKVIASFMKYLHIFEMKARPVALFATFMAGAVASVAVTVGWLTGFKKRGN
ncbi:Aldehyde dehydrogenase family 3 member B1 [Orchesella cincta]|uniref:Aldehyde dehydrogenase n=1 Tax=Orchesella cincta TaxID=48709 RepID=A0A1D2NHG7_ORCCI|nr:Aldehyde dehydrogenase family 3 member B1 [Orchesella cincta]